MVSLNKFFNHEESLNKDMKQAGLVESKETKTPQSPLEKLEEELLNNSKEDINFSTKLKTLNEKLSILKKQQKDSKDKTEKSKIQEEINSANREKNRLIRLTQALKGKEIPSEGQEKDDIENMSAKKLLSAEKEKSGFLSGAFAYKQEIDKDGNTIENPLTSQNDVKEGDKIFIDFGKNKGAYWKVGAGDILPPSIKILKIKDTNGNMRTGLRGIQGNKVGYYDERGYIPIYNNFTLEIPKKGEEKNLMAGIKQEKLEITSGDENAAKLAYLENLDKEEEREARIRAMNIEENKDFIKNATDLSKEIEKSYGIPWQVTFGQATLESGWGKSGLAKEGNYFGIKGKGKSFATKEEYSGQMVTIQDSFRVYGSMKDSFIDYARLLSQKPLYKNAFRYAANINPRPEYYPKDYNSTEYNPEKFLDTIIKAGYATDSRYVDKVAKLWKSNNIDTTQMA